MATTQGNIFLDALDVPTTVPGTPAFTVTDAKVVINNATATNYGTSTATLTVYVVASGKSAEGLTKATISLKIGPGETAIIGDLMARPILLGGSIQAESDTATSISLSIGGSITTST